MQLKKHYKSVFENEPELLKALIDIHLDGKDIDDEGCELLAASKWKIAKISLRKSSLS